MPASDWNELCPFTIVWEAALPKDDYGKPTGYAAPVMFAPPTGGRRSYKTVRRTVGGGNTPAGSVVDFMNVSYIWLLAPPNIGLEDRIYVQGDAPLNSNGDRPPILGIDAPPDELGDLDEVSLPPWLIPVAAADLAPAEHAAFAARVRVGAESRGHAEVHGPAP